MATPKHVTVLIANYNGESFLDRALRSVLAQQFSNEHYEILLADDGSTDGSLNIAQRYAHAIRLLSLQHAGLAATCNEGIVKATGRYLIRLDADDELEQTALAKMSTELDRRLEVAFVTTDRWEIDDRSGQSHLFKVDPSNMYDWIAPGVMFRTSTLLEVGLYSHLYWEEYDLFIRLLKKFKAFHLDLPLYRYHRHSQSMTANAEARRVGWKVLIQKWGMEELREFGSCQELEDTFASNEPEARRPSVLVAAQDAGGCNALLPVLKSLRSQSLRLTILAHGPAQNIFKKGGFDFQSMNPDTDEVHIKNVFDSFQPDFVFVGNSYGRSLEDIVVKHAQGRGTPSVGILDSWLLYEQKFSDGSDRWAFLPDRLIVMDDLAKHEMMALGAPMDRLIPLGQPQFDHLFLPSLHPSDAEKQAMRASLGIKKDERLILFLSQDMENFYGGAAAARATLGYTEHEVFDLLKDRIETLSRIRHQSIRLVVKLHPREDRNKYRSSGILTLSDVDPYPLLLCADLTVGMDTILLIEAGLLECVTLSLQPHRKGLDTLVTNRLAIGSFCYQPENLQETLGRLLFDDEFRKSTRQDFKRFPVQPGATQRITQWLLHSLLQKVS